MVGRDAIDRPVGERFAGLVQREIVARTDLLAGTSIPGENVTTRAHVPSGHKVATRPIAKGEAIKRYNQIIGFATGDIAVGDHVHTHNCAMGDFARDYAYCANMTPTQYANEAATFQGILRKDGRVATRNYIGILTSVNCSATVANYIAEAFKAKLGESVLFPKRLGVPDELASMVVECLTNAYMNGEVVRVDGGIRMPPK